MARVPDVELARIKAETSVQRLVEGCGVELRRQGKDLVGRCPFHDDETPSLVVTPGKNLWHCLGACQRGGGPVDWVMTAQGVSFRHAVELLRESSPSLGVLAQASPLAAERGPVGRSQTVKLAPLVAPDAAGQELLATVVGFYAETLTGGDGHAEALGFLAHRRIGAPEAIETFRIGFADRTLGYRLPNSQLRDGKAVRTRLRDLGVIKASGHEHFRGYLTFPVLDADGQVGEVYGRRLDPAGDPRHLYLPGPHRGVWNIAALAETDELIVCESIIDALTLWCAGFRHVTAAYGVEGWTPEHQQAVVEHGIRRVLVAFDADPAGDQGAKTLAGELASAGVESYRVELPPSTDVNEIAVAATNPTDVLGKYLRKAAWMDALARPAARRPASRLTFQPPAPESRPESAPEPVVLAAPEPPQAAVVAPGLDSPAHVVEPVEPTPQEPADEVGAGGQGAVVGRELVIELGTRRWRVRGLDKVTSFDVLRVNLLVTRTDRPGLLADAASTPGSVHGTGFHVDTLDLYSARARSVFVTQAAAELRFEAEVVKADLGRVLLACEAKAEEVIAAAQAPAKSEVRLTSAQRDAALDLLRDPDLVGRIERDFARVGMVGEQTNCLVGYLTAVSRLLPSPLAVIVQSTSAAGKSAVMEAVLGFVPDEDRVSFSAMTGQSLFYLGESDLSHKVLSIAEEEGASRAVYALKLLQSEGELSIASTGKDTASGRLVTHTYSVRGPTAIVLTTTAVDVDEELLNRCLVLTVDEDRDQTKAIHTAQRRAQTLEGLAARTERDQVVGVHRDAQRLLEPLAIVNPYAGRLTFADGRTRTRRDHGKYLGLIAAVTLLHQHQRERKTATVGGKSVSYVETTIADIEVAHRLAHAVLGQSLDDLAPQTRRLLTAVHAFVAAEAKRHAIGLDLVRFTRRQLREHLATAGAGWGDTQLKVHLARLVDLELVLVHRLESGAFGYELLWNPPGAAPTTSSSTTTYDAGYDGAGRFLVGLMDPATLRDNSYDHQPVGPQAALVGPWSGPGRPVVGPRSDTETEAESEPDEPDLKWVSGDG